MNSDKPTAPAQKSLSIALTRSRQGKILLGALIGTLIVNILCLPQWTDYDMIGFMRTPFNKEARMEIVYAGVLTGAESLSIISAEPSLSTPANYSYRRGIQLCTIDFPVGRGWKPYNLTLRARREGWIDVQLKGPNRSNDYGEPYSIATDYRNLKINDKEIFPGRKTVTHAKYFSYRMPVKANDTIKIAFEGCRHYFDTDDFHLLKTKNFWYIITLSILAFIVSYNLLYRICLAAYRSRRTEDTVFLVIFFLLLVVPMSNISDAKRGAREMRNLKERPKVSSILRDGANFGKEYDDWFCDHLGGRDCLLKCHGEIQRAMQLIIKNPSAWYMQESGWSFRPPFAAELRPEHVPSIVSGLAALETFCEKNHIKLYFFVVPRRESIYQEKLYGYGLDKKKESAANAIHEQLRLLSAKQHITYIYPWMELREASKRDYTFPKLMHHWSDWGAYTGYRALMDVIRKDFPDIPVVSLEDYKLTRSGLIRDERARSFQSGGWIKRFFNFDVDRHHPPTLYNYYDHKNADKLMFKMDDYTKDFAYVGGGGIYKIMLIGTSQNENLLGFLPYSAAETRFIRVNQNLSLPPSEQWKIMKYYAKDMLSYKPDILIFSIYEHDMLCVRKIFEK